MDGMRDKSGDPTFRPAASKPFDIGDFVKLIGASCLTAQYRRSLRAIRCVNSIYQNLEGATIPLNVLDISLKEAKWLDYRRPVDDDGDFTDFEHFFPKRKEPMDRGFFPRASRFACIAMFESGIHNLDPSVFDPVVAMASANSLFVAAELVADPSELCQHAIKRVIGNVGRAGISLLVLPQLAPRVKELGYDWRAVPHEDYNFEREDNFQHTNLVLSFTEWSRPVQVAQRGSIGEDVFLIECVLSVHDRGKWVADIDPMNHNIMKWDVSCTCPKQVEPTLTAIDSWEELLDAPDNVAVFRANGNIYARLGAVAIRKSQGTDQQKRTLIVPPGVKPCFRCVGHLDKAVIID
ncbi:hypothetical protein PMZ80_007111 [Knufia obscura]|uniref:Uncharacterized protein n=1 Tax=Knufia obscura TaxID=1635080 RepID=A0ABR0RJ98_9EURO|nr:hypothetical protein PMZ80_007111 [Knufia obscura]